MAVAVKSQAQETESSHCLAGDLSWLLGQAHYALASEVIAAFEPVGVSARGYHVLVVAATGEFTQTELTELLGLDKTTLLVTIDELEEAGLAERRPSNRDRRARLITVTKAGKRKIAEGEQLIKQVQDDVLSTLPPRERKIFLETLAGLVKTRLSEPVACKTPLRRR